MNVSMSLERRGARSSIVEFFFVSDGTRSFVLKTRLTTDFFGVFVAVVLITSFPRKASPVVVVVVVVRELGDVKILPRADVATTRDCCCLRD